MYEREQIQEDAVKRRVCYPFPNIFAQIILSLLFPPPFFSFPFPSLLFFFHHLILFPLFFCITFYLLIVWVHMCLVGQVKVRGQLAEVSSLISPSEAQGSQSLQLSKLIVTSVYQSILDRQTDRQADRHADRQAAS